MKCGISYIFYKRTLLFHAFVVKNPSGLNNRVFTSSDMFVP